MQARASSPSPPTRATVPPTTLAQNNQDITPHSSPDAPVANSPAGKPHVHHTQLTFDDHLDDTSTPPIPAPPTPLATTQHEVPVGYNPDLPPSPHLEPPLRCSACNPWAPAWHSDTKRLWILCIFTLTYDYVHASYIIVCHQSAPYMGIHTWYIIVCYQSAPYMEVLTWFTMVWCHIAPYMDLHKWYIRIHHHSSPYMDIHVYMVPHSMIPECTIQGRTYMVHHSMVP